MNSARRKTALKKRLAHDQACVVRPAKRAQNRIPHHTLPSSVRGHGQRRTSCCFLIPAPAARAHVQANSHGPPIGQVGPYSSALPFPLKFENQGRRKSSGPCTLLACAGGSKKGVDVRRGGLCQCRSVRIPRSARAQVCKTASPSWRRASDRGRLLRRWWMCFVQWPVGARPGLQLTYRRGFMPVSLGVHQSITYSTYQLVSAEAPMGPLGLGPKCYTSPRHSRHGQSHVSWASDGHAIPHASMSTRYPIRDYATSPSGEASISVAAARVNACAAYLVLTANLMVARQRCWPSTCRRANTPFSTLACLSSHDMSCIMPRHYGITVPHATIQYRAVHCALCLLSSANPVSRTAAIAAAPLLHDCSSIPARDGARTTPGPSSNSPNDVPERSLARCAPRVRQAWARRTQTYCNTCS
ncbi:hypothetical protein BD413DRAFT_96374 [Trametes elegans]|nr:hypothetical protein BD413DRAFT_96374 [Trametes elegans]